MDDTARLNLARRAWRATAASDRELEAGARRLRVALATRPGRRRIGSRTVAAGVGALVLGAALAYAAHSALSPTVPAPASPPPTPKLGQVPSEPRPAAGAQRGASTRSDQTRRLSEAPPSDPGVAAPLAPTPRAQRSEPPLPSSAEDIERKQSVSDPVHATGSGQGQASADIATWRQVDEALSAGDSARAQTELERLTRSRDVVTRAKARLGLAQLAASAGDCQRTRSLVAQLSMSPGVPAELIARGRRLALQCK
jgi:hypothetical protein